MRAICCAVLAAVATSAFGAEKAGVAESKGLKVTAAPTMKRFPTGAAPEVEVTFTNTSKKTYAICDANFWIYAVNMPRSTWHCVLNNQDDGKTYKPTVVIAPRIYRFPQAVRLKPGKSHSTVVRLDTKLSYPPVAADADDGKAGLRPLGPMRKPLPEGRYQVAFTLKLFKPKPERGPKPVPGPFWVGTIEVTTAALELGGKVDTKSWTTLWAAEKWYKSAKGKEQEFTGVLKSHKQPAFSTLMRSCRYTLGGRRIYPGKENPVLEQLVGKKVTIRGKAVEMSLEGRRLKELWVGAVKRAK
jgi:hypothetical protein